MKLTNPTTRELSNAVAEFVAGWTFLKAEKDTGAFKVAVSGWFNEQGFFVPEAPSFASSTVEAFPLLTVKRGAGRRVNIEMGFNRWRVWIHEPDPVTKLYDGLGTDRNPDGEDEQLARAICIALLRNAGHEVI